MRLLIMFLKASQYKRILSDVVEDEDAFTRQAIVAMDDFVRTFFMQHIMPRIRRHIARQKGLVRLANVGKWARKTMDIRAKRAAAYMKRVVERAGYASDAEAPLTEKAQTSLKIGQFMVALMGAETEFEEVFEDEAMIGLAALAEYWVRWMGIECIHALQEDEEMVSEEVVKAIVRLETPVAENM